MKKAYGLIIVLCLAAGCTGKPISTKPVNLPECYAIYDAGSTGTRLFIYYQKNSQWIEKGGLETQALTEPGSIPKIVNLLEEIRKTTDADKAFDWTTDCSELFSIQVLATAGMRLMEKNDPIKSSSIWKNINSALRTKYDGTTTEFSTKTITGYEEGLYDWLATKEWRKGRDIKGIHFGVTGMGGASSQVAFPCGSNCFNAKTIIVDQQEVEFFIHSFLKLGTTQLPASLQPSSPTIPDTCKWGVAEKSGWKKEFCVKSIKPTLLNTSGAIKDPDLNSFISIPENDHLTQWYLTGSLAYMDARQNGDVQSCCELRRSKYDGCYQEEMSCYLAVYQPLYLEALGIRNVTDAKPSKASWTMGAAICIASNCLKKLSAPRSCQWLAASKCLPEPNPARP